MREAQIILCVLAVVPWVLFGLRYRNYMGYAVAPVAFLLHIIIFNIARLHHTGDMYPTVLNVWSIGIRIQGIISFAILGLGLYLDIKNNGFNGGKH
jgi:hypothetical protein